MVFFLISDIVVGLLDQLQIFWQLYLIELLGLLTGFGMLVCFINLSLMEFQDRHLALFLHFSIVNGFEWLWMGCLHKNIQLMLEFLKAPFLALHFFWYTLVTFIMMLSEILLYVLMICMCDQVSDHWQQLEFAAELISMRHCGLGQEVACWFQCWKNSTGFVWLV